MRRGLLLPFAVVACVVVACSAAPPGEELGEISQANTSVCPANVVEGIDVSDGQGTIDWAKVYAAGKRFAFMKATQGDYNQQSTFKANWTGSKAAGVYRSPYHFFDPTIDGVTQANYFLAEVTAAGGFEPGDLPPMLDVECPTDATESAASANCEYTGNSGWEPSATISSRIFDWLSTVEAATGMKAVVYSYSSWFGDIGVTDARLAGYPLYIATLSTCASVPPPWTTTTFWQYSFTGTTSGISDEVDLDRFVGTLAQLGSFADPDGGAPLTDAGADGAVHDAGAADARATDAAVHDSGAHDAAPSDAAHAGDAKDVEPAVSSAEHGCTCGVASEDRGFGGWAIGGASMAGLLFVSRRRASFCRAFALTRRGREPG